MPALIAPVGAPHRQTNSQTFSYTGYEQTFMVPSYVTEVTIKADGASGGTGTGSGSFSGFPAGGSGGVVKATILVTPSESLAVFVGGEGTDNGGGYNGGASPGSCGSSCYEVTQAGALGRFAAPPKAARPDNISYFYPAYGGGGASDVRQGGDGLADRVVVAGGGGGAGGTAFQCFNGCKQSAYYYGGPGGRGGGKSGGSGGGGSSGSSGGDGGGCATRTRGGSGGIGGYGSGSGSCDGVSGSDGTLSSGGDGGDGSCDEPGGGGGGGNYGGGGGGSSGLSTYYYERQAYYAGGGGGGGGSSFVEKGAKHVKSRPGAAPVGNGRIIISW
jgi:hypothetical protein